MAEFIRDHALLTILAFLLLIVAGNIALFMQSKNPEKNLKDWFMMKNAGESMGDPWKEETEQLNELSDRVAEFKKEQADIPDKQQS